MKAPAFQFYVQDFLIGTLHFTAEETGAYLRLLCEQWDKGYVKNDAEYIQNVTGVPKEKLARVLQKFTRSRSRMVNQRLEQEREKQRQYRDSRSRNAKNAGRPKKSYDSSEENICPALQSSTSSSSSKKKNPTTSDKAPSTGNYLPLADLKEKVSADTGFIAEFTRLGLYVHQVRDWLTAFNKHLTYLGETQKEERDYRHHFGHWLRKIDYQHTTPDDYQPGGASPPGKARNIVATSPFQSKN